MLDNRTEVKMIMKMNGRRQEDLIGHIDICAVQNGVQPIQILVNGEVSWEGDVTPGEITFPIKGADDIEIDIKIPNAVSPQEAGTGADVQELGLAITKMWIDER